MILARPCTLQRLRYISRSRPPVPARSGPVKHTVCMSSLAQKKCEPCEQAQDALGSMGMSMAFDRKTAEEYLSKVDNWKLFEDELRQLRIRKKWRTKNFLKGLEFCRRIGDIAEAEGHHPDLHLTEWNNMAVEIWTHARGGLSENDFILAAKIDELEKSDLLSKKQPTD
eukprot:jgi/Chrzof1/9920/Cz04g20250.t1